MIVNYKLNFFFFNNPAPPEIYPLPLPDALPIFEALDFMVSIDIYVNDTTRHADVILPGPSPLQKAHYDLALRSEEHTSELQSRQYLVCRLLLEKKKKKNTTSSTIIQLYTLTSLN